VRAHLSRHTSDRTQRRKSWVKPYPEAQVRASHLTATVLQSKHRTPSPTLLSMCPPRPNLNYTNPENCPKEGQHPASCPPLRQSRFFLNTTSRLARPRAAVRVRQTPPCPAPTFAPVPLLLEHHHAARQLCQRGARPHQRAQHAPAALPPALARLRRGGGHGICMQAVKGSSQ